MPSSEQEKIIKDTISEFLEKMELADGLEIIVEKDENDSLKVNLSSDQSRFLIGKMGNNLHALQHLIRIIANKKNPTDEPINFSLDINNYRLNQKRNLQNLALETAEQVATENKAVILEPMNAYQRRLIHLELENFDGVLTESIGEGEERKVAIKPKSVSDEIGL